MKTPEKKKRRKFGFCKFCGERYQKHRDWQEFCTPDHRRAFHHKGGPDFLRFEQLTQTLILKAERRIVSRVVELLRKLGVTKEIRDKFRADAEHELNNRESIEEMKKATA
jgi:hypothetical protein